MTTPTKPTSSDREKLNELQTWIEDVLDADAHSDRLPVKINFSDIEVIAELLAPEVKAKIDQAIAQREEELVDKVLSIIPDEVCTGRLGGLEAYTKEDEAVNAFISKIKQDLQSIKEDK